MDVSKITGIDKYEEKAEKDRRLYLKDDKVFLVLNKNMNR